MFTIIKGGPTTTKQNDSASAAAISIVIHTNVITKPWITIFLHFTVTGIWKKIEEMGTLLTKTTKVTEP